MKTRYISIFLFLLLCRSLFAEEILKFSCEFSSNPMILNCRVENVGKTCTIEILKSALAEDGAKTVYPDAQYNFIAFFPEAEDGERVEECVGKIFSAYPSTEQDTVISLKPGSSYKFSRQVVSRNPALVARLKSEPFSLFWRVSLKYKSIYSTDDGGKLLINDYNGFLERNGKPNN